MREIKLALNICTYHREDYIRKNVQKLLQSDFFQNPENSRYGNLHIYIVDNASEIVLDKHEFLHIFYSPNFGGSGGFQRGLEEIRVSKCDFTHIIFMDDDVEFDISSFYLLFDFLKNVDEEYMDRPIAGRMFCMDQPEIQYTAAEIWNKGNLQHIEFMRKVTEENYFLGRVNYDCGAEYGGWWFCCYPMSFARENDILPFFIHCDDVEYGLRCGKTPVIIEGVQVWHETFDKRMTPLIRYYDTRNPLFVNELYSLESKPDVILAEWKDKITQCHVQENWLEEYYLILAMRDFLRGIKWLKRIHSGKYHKKLQKVKSNRFKNALSWRIVERKFRRKYKMKQ